MFATDGAGSLPLPQGPGALREGYLPDTFPPPRQRLLDRRCGQPYTCTCSLTAIARTGAAMKPTKSGSRVVVIGSTAAANERTGSLPSSPQRPTTRRIVVIKDGELVGGRRGR